MLETSTPITDFTERIQKTVKSASFNVQAQRPYTLAHKVSGTICLTDQNEPLSINSLVSLYVIVFE